MKLRFFLIANAVVLGVSGLCAVILPKSVLSLYGVTSDPAATLMAQYAGLGSIAISLIAWFGRDMNEAQAKKLIIPAFLISFGIGVIISVLGTISGIMKIGWAVVGLYLVFALGYAYFQFFKRSND